MHRTTMWSRPESPGFGRRRLFGSQPGRTRPAVRPVAATPARNSRRVVMVAVLAAGRRLVIRPCPTDRVHGHDPTPGATMAKRRATVIGAMAAATLLLASCVKFDVDVLGGDGTTGRANGTPGSSAAQNYLVSLPGSLGGRRQRWWHRARRLPPGLRRRDEHHRHHPWERPGRRIRHRGCPLRRSGRLVPRPRSRRHHLQRCHRQRDGRRRRAGGGEKLRPLPHPTPPLTGVRVLGPGGGRPPRLAPLPRQPPRAARRRGDLRELRHPGRQPAGEPARRHLRHRCGDRGPAPSGHGGGSDRSEHARRPGLQPRLRPGPQRPRALHRVPGSPPCSSRTPRGPATTPTWTTQRSSTTRSSAQQIGTAQRLVRDLANTPAPPSFQTGQPLATFADAATLAEVANRFVEIDDLPPDVRTDVLADREAVNAIVAAGPSAFDAADITTVLLAALRHGRRAHLWAVRRVPRRGLTPSARLTRTASGSVRSLAPHVRGRLDSPDGRSRSWPRPARGPTCP